MRTVVVALCVAVMALGAIGMEAGAADADLEISIDISPKVFILGLDSAAVTVHTSIKRGLVVASTVEMDGISATSVFADSRGYMVAKFPQSAVHDIVAPPEATLTLTGVTTAGQSFAGSDTVVVKIARKP